MTTNSPKKRQKITPPDLSIYEPNTVLMNHYKVMAAAIGIPSLMFMASLTFARSKAEKNIIQLPLINPIKLITIIRMCLPDSERLVSVTGVEITITRRNKILFWEVSHEFIKKTFEMETRFNGFRCRFVDTKEERQLEDSDDSTDLYKTRHDIFGINPSLFS